IDVFVDTFKPLLFDSIRAQYPYCYRCPLKKTHPRCALACLKDFEAMMKERHNEIAACIVEPLFEGAAGIITMPAGFYKGIRSITKKYGVLLIADEVATGFGRTGAYFASIKEGVRPDMICLAKGLSGGYLPLAATIATDEIYGAFLDSYHEFKAFFHGHTYTGNPLGCAAALASIELFRKEKVLQRVRPKITLLAGLLRPMSSMKNVGDVRQCGLAAGVELVKDKSTKERFGAAERIGARICAEARRHGVLLRPLGDTIVIMPPLSVTDKELKQITSAISSSVETVLGAQ
ncbi:MAG: aminotransferase class III-fold pyridoxal phosphate-dependent enzyme, partial [Nitrospirota bacterium]|nr:aminotransferase class III-fold pyridoxal phosphate-dependent enzyme [Nitrospirota bacterium]